MPEPFRLVHVARGIDGVPVEANPARLQCALHGLALVIRQPHTHIRITVRPRACGTNPNPSEDVINPIVASRGVNAVQILFVELIDPLGARHSPLLAQSHCNSSSTAVCIVKMMLLLAVMGVS